MGCTARRWQWVPELVPAQGELLIHKNFNSSFENTALERGCDLTLVNDAHTTKTMDLGDGAKLEAHNLVQDLNIAMTWLSYPGRKNATAPAEEVTFQLISQPTA